RTTPVRRQPSPGWLLVGLIVLISAVILALVGITFYLTEHLRTTSLRQNQTKAIYLAQAGVMRELYDYRRGQEISLGEQTVTAGPLPGTADDDVFNISGPNADFLLVNMRDAVSFANSNLCPSRGPERVSRQRIRNWAVRNVLASGESSLTVDAMRINWFPYPPADDEGILRIDLNGTNSNWEAPGCVAAARNSVIDITPNVTLTPGQRWNNNQIWFTATSGMDAKDWIDVTFILSDSGERTSRYVPPNPDQSWADFTLRSVGEVRRGAFPFSVWRRLRVEYRVCAQSGDIGEDCSSAGDEQRNEGAIVAYEELNSQTP
ncbi:MAG: hypothetical protein HY353_00305, partial [Candidatus Omnitrophica bacterium]|nr:hypothetical protein [Candidatus Omnitrophota bacterium]